MAGNLKIDILPVISLSSFCTVKDWCILVWSYDLSVSLFRASKSFRAQFDSSCQLISARNSNRKSLNYSSGYFPPLSEPGYTWSINFFFGPCSLDLIISAAVGVGKM